MVISSTYKVWVIMAKNSLQNKLLSPSSSIIFILGKLFNYVFSVLIIYSIFNQVSTIKNFTLPQAVIITLVYSLIDSITQFLFRSLYSFRPILLKGDFDLDLLKPLPSFFRPMLSGPDFLDVPMIILQIVALFFFLTKFSLVPSPITLLLFLLISTNGIILAFSLHLIIAAFSIITTEIDSLVMIYRSLSRAAVVPTDIYNNFFRTILSYVIPITVIFTLPAKAILNLLSFNGIVYSTIFTFTFLLFSLYFWKFSLRRYTSASS
ncbi:MAG: ABC-2 family transporter protein [Candidatus Shapirobacteria bacterium]